MDKEYYASLAEVRLSRAKELLKEAQYLLEKESFKSANNRAFYAIEKSIRALLALERIETMTHNGNLKQFNYHYIYKGDGTFTPEDYKMIAKAEQIRNASDYDDFYVASKSESIQQVQDAEYIVNKIAQFISNSRQL